MFVTTDQATTAVAACAIDLAPSIKTGFFKTFKWDQRSSIGIQIDMRCQLYSCFIFMMNGWEFTETPNDDPFKILHQDLRQHHCSLIASMMMLIDPFGKAICI